MNTNEPYISKIYLLDVPLKNNYKDTLYFSSSQNQQTYFQGKLVQTYGWENFSYQRKDNVIRVPKHYDEINGHVNYVMYQNSYYNNKWFYAFITNIEYINDGCTDITIETDVIQTWMFDYTVNQSFVEREHVANDGIGVNTLPENLETGEYKLMSNDKIGDIFDTSNCLQVIALTQLITPLNTIVTNVQSPYKNPDVVQGIKYIVVEDTTTAKIIIDYYDDKGKGESIYSMFVAPRDLFPSASSQFWETVPLVFNEGESDEYTVNVKACTTTVWNMQLAQSVNVPSNLINYTPRNKKLLCFPYKYAQLTNENGQSTNLYLENFYTYPQSIGFKYYGALSPSCNFRIIPQNYKLNGEDYDEGLTLAKLPIGSWTTDVYTNWLTQNALNLSTQIERANFNIGANTTSSAISSLGNVVSGALNLVEGHLSGATQNITNSATSLMSGYSSYGNGLYDIQSVNAMKYEHSLQPPQAKGNLNSCDVGYYYNYLTPRLKVYSIKPEYARIIDDYFDMYGYQTNLVKTPNSNHRQEWWYTKTINANITGAIPNDDITKIRNAYDNGITFWKDPDHIYNYGLPNPII